jgi:hypothetical protein
MECRCIFILPTIRIFAIANTFFIAKHEIIEIMQRINENRRLFIKTPFHTINHVISHSVYIDTPFIICYFEWCFPLRIALTQQTKIIIDNVAILIENSIPNGYTTDILLGIIDEFFSTNGFGQTIDFSTVCLV